MAYRICKNHNNRTVILRDAVTTKPLDFDCREDAQAFADSCQANDRCDYRNQGRRIPKYEVVA